MVAGGLIKRIPESNLERWNDSAHANHAYAEEIAKSVIDGDVLR
jgi:trehalose-6-phosphate synthase